jgi:hypothetical protein
MNNHYFGIDVNVFLFGKFPDTVNGPHKVDSGDKAKQNQDVKAEVDKKEFPKIDENSI